MTLWQRRARLIIGLFGVGFAVVVFFAIREREHPAAAVVKPGDPKAMVESTGAVVIQARGERQDFRIEADRQMTYAGGATKLLGVKILVDQRAGRNFVVQAKEAEVTGEQAHVALAGNVRLAASDGLRARTDRASYDRGEGFLRAPGAVQFARGGLSGSSKGMTYDQDRDVLTLLERAAVRLEPSPSQERQEGQTGLEIAAGHAVIARRDKYLRFEGNARIVNGARVAEAVTATAFLTPDESRVERLELVDQARISSPPAGPGALREMKANSMNLSYAPDGRTLQRALLTGAAAIQIEGAENPAGRELSGDWLDISLAPDGTTVTSLAGRDRVQLEFPAEGQTPARRIRAGSIEGAGEAPQGLTLVKFADQVEYREAGGGPATGAREGRGPIPRVVRAERLQAAVKPGLGEIEDATFSGSVRFEDGRIRAVAASARYQIAKGHVYLEGADPGTGDPPQVSDGETIISARLIDLTLDGHTIAAQQDVRSVLQPADQTRGANARRPGILREDQPVYAAADRLVYDSDAGRATYTGNARLWQGETAVQGDTLILDDRKGDLRVTDKARSTMVLEQVDQQTKASEKVTTVASARELNYEEAIRRATYTTNAHVTGSQGDLKAEKVELYLREGGGELDRAEAYGSVTLRSEGRTATGDRLTYFAADERYVMTGASVKIVEECRETTGKTLTFFKSTDRIVVDGNEETRTQTKGGGKCSEPQFD